MFYKRIDVSNLFNGQVFPNYKVLCEEIGEEPCSGNSKISQLKNWGRFFKWHRDKQAYIIDEVFGKSN